MRNIFFYTMFLLIFFPSCKDKSEKLAEDFCECLKETGLKNGMPSFSLIDDISNEECFKNMLSEMQSELKKLNHHQRAEFMKNYFKELLKTDCAEVAFEYLPYETMLKQMEREFKKQSSSDSDFFSNEPSICECVKMYEQMSAEYRATSDENNMRVIEKKYKEKMDACTNLSEGKTNEEKRQMEKEAENCR